MKEIRVYVVGGTYSGKSTVCAFIAEKLRELCDVEIQVNDLDNTKIEKPSKRIECLDKLDRVVIEEVNALRGGVDYGIQSFEINHQKVSLTPQKPNIKVGDIIICRSAEGDNWYRTGDRMLVRSEPFLVDQESTNPYWAVHVTELLDDGRVVIHDTHVWVDVSQFELSHFKLNVSVDNTQEECPVSCFS